MTETPDYWSLYRAGTASAATTAPGTPPALGLAFDLGLGGWQSGQQFDQFARDTAALQQQATLEQAEATREQTLYEMELQRAQNLEDNPLTGKPDDASYFDKAVGFLGSVPRIITGSIEHPDSDPPPSYDEYREAGGILSEEDYNSFSDQTKRDLAASQDLAYGVGKALSVPIFPAGPGENLSLGEGLEYSYRGLTTPLNMIHRSANQNPNGVPFNLSNVLNPMWFDGSNWAQAWRESQDTTPGNEVLNSLLSPYTSEERLEDWSRTNSFYQFSSLAAEIGVTWYADPAVIAGKGVGGLSRAATGRMPQNPRLQMGVYQALRGEPVTQYGPVARLRANSIQRRQADVEAAAKTLTYGEFTSLPMFRGRTIAGAPAAHMLHYAINSGDDALKDLTWRTLYGDPKAWAELNRLRADTPEQLKKYAPGTQNVLDAVDAAKTRIKSLEDEAEKLNKALPLDENGKLPTQAPFFQWERYTDLQQARKEIAETTAVLEKYEPYHTWLELATGRHGARPELARVSGGGGLKRRTFHAAPYGKAHTVASMPRATYIQRAGLIGMHDLDSGSRSINRIFDQLGHLMAYVDDEARDAALQGWASAATAYDRYKLLYDLEMTHLPRALAQRFDVSEEFARGLLLKIESEQDLTRQAILNMKGTIYESAPSIGARIADPNHQGIKLVEVDDEGMATIELLDNTHHKMTIQVPEEALASRKLPVDPTQTPNYYSPIDTRRLFLEFKRHQDLAQVLDRGRMANGQAGLMEAVDYLGTKFNSFWKPFQLFRLGWPQRVMMDEGMRAMAIFGPMYWVTGPGAEAAAIGLSNIPFHVKSKYQRLKHGKVPLGKGSVSRAEQSTPDPLGRRAEEAAAVQIPAVDYPKINPGRHSKIAETATAAADWKRRLLYLQAYRREFDDLDATRPDPRYMDEDPNFDKRLDEWIERRDRLIAAYGAYGLPYRDIIQQLDEEIAVHLIETPSRPTRAVIQDLTSFTSQAEFAAKGPLVHDATTGKRVQSGYVVPIYDPNLTASLHTAANSELALIDWIEKNAEILARQGLRIVTDHQGNVTVGRVFRSNEFNKARKFAELVDDVFPGVEMWDIGKGKSFKVVDADATSPFYQTLLREFQSEAEIERTPGSAPIEEGERIVGGRLQVEPGDVIHGTDEPLPEHLSPRERVPVATGRRFGEGLYTSTSEAMVKGFNFLHLYQLRNSRTGRKYKVFDLDRTPTRAQIDELLEFAQAFRLDPFERQTLELAFSRGRNSAFHSHTPDDGSVSWANAMEYLDDHWNGQGRNLLQAAVTNYLDHKGFGALHHRGGGTTGNDHHVYVWLHPEDLELKPLYANSGRYVPLERWLLNPDAVENVVPESNLIRKGLRNPMLRELRTLSRQIADEPNSPELLAREAELMDALGLGYRELGDDGGFIIRSEEPSTPGLPDRYVTTDPGRFQRTVDEAKAEDYRRGQAALARGELRAQEQSVEEIGEAFDDFDFQIDSVLGRFAQRIFKQRAAGVGYQRMRSSDGQEFVVEKAFEGHRGQLMRGLVGSSRTLDVLTEGHGGALAANRRRAAGYRTYNPVPLVGDALKRGTRANKRAIRYYQAWAEVLNDQVAHSPIWSKMLRGWDDDRIVRWLENSPEGARVRQEVAPLNYKDSPELWVHEHREKLNYYLPNRELQRKLAQRRLDPSDLRRNIHDDDMPTVYGPDVEILDKRRPASQFISDMVDHIYHGIGTVPIDTLSRHPFARAVYDAKMRTLIGSTDSKWLTQDMIETMQEQARQYAMDQVRRTLFDLTDMTNFTDALRFMAPFWGAQQEAITKWLRIVGDRPETIGRFFAGQRAVYNNFFVIDEEGNPVDRGTREGGLHGLGLYHPTDRVILQIPESMRKGPLGKALMTIGEVGVPIGSANTVLQGELPTMPSLGPVITVPADQALRMVSDTYGVEHDESFLYRWLFPIGRPKSQSSFGRIMEQISPGWARRVQSVMGAEDDIAYANMFFQTSREMTLEAQRKGEPPPSEEEIARQTKWLYALRVVAGMALPVQAEFRPKNQFWVDMAHKYQRDFGQDWWDRFIDDFGPQAATYASASSESIGVPPTSEGMEQFSANKDLISDFPEWADAIVDPEAWDDDFSFDSYYAQFGINVGPGDSTKLRELVSPAERIAEANRRLGWREYRQFQSAIEAELYARGLTDIRQSAAEDLLFAQRGFLSDLQARNADWYEDYEERGNAIYTRVNELAQFAFDPRFDNRPDMLGVRQYLILREQVVAQLDANGAAGMSRSLEAEDNAYLAEWFYGNVGQLVQDNPAFAEFYTRYLTRDTLERGSG